MKKVKVPPKESEMFEALQLDIIQRLPYDPGLLKDLRWFLTLHSSVRREIAVRGVMVDGQPIRSTQSCTNRLRSSRSLHLHDGLLTSSILPYIVEDGFRDIEPIGYTDLPRHFTDANIIEHMGGHEVAVRYASTMNQVEVLLAEQILGEQSQLSDIHSNIFYVVGERGRLFSVQVAKPGKKWELSAWDPAKSGFHWNMGDRIFHDSRISVLA